MSLSKEILEGTYAGVERLLAQRAEVNIVDEYGYTPLIHACATNRFDLVQLLLKHNADPNIMDMSGSTALHWAVDNNNIEISNSLLKFGANPNAYSENGQPILFYPLLRKNRMLIQMLLEKGANIDFAKDYIQAKLLGHRFELKGTTDIINAEGYFLPIDLEGFYLEFTIQVICESLERFISSYVARRMDIHEFELKQIVKAFQNAARLRDFKHFSINVEASKSQIYPHLDVDLLLLPVSYRGHAITFIKHGEFFAKCDRGVEKMTTPITIHHIGNPKPLTHEFMIKLLYERQTERSIKYELVKMLALEPYAKLPIRHQVTGNCSWANSESSVPTMLYMLLHDKIRDKSKVDALVKEIMAFYRTWLEWDKDRAIEDWVLDFEKISFARQKSKAALLGAVLFQGNANNPYDIERAKKIMKILTRKEFQYVLKIYANIFVRGAKTSQGKAFTQLVEASGYKLSQFI